MSQNQHNASHFDPHQAHFFDLINEEVKLTEDELKLLKRNGFVSTDRLRFKQFKRAYAWIYWKDLPVLVTSDSILHAIHQTYDELLKQVEITILTQKLIDMLSGARDYLRETVDNAPDDLKPLYNDLDVYLSVPIVLLSMDSSVIWLRPKKDMLDNLPEQIREWILRIAQINRGAEIVNIDNEGHAIRSKVKVGIETITLFGLQRDIDFTQFRARGHYDKPTELVKYFCAMMWLQLLDFRFVEIDSIGEAKVHPKQIASAILLKDAIEASNQQQNWDDIDRILSAYVGTSDNITLNGLQAFCDDLPITSATDCLTIEDDILLQTLIQNDYGQQSIRGGGQSRHPSFEGTLSHQITFALMGGRYTIESEIMQRLIYDKLSVDGKPPRAYPSPFDVMYALGNNHAKIHLTNELELYGYEHQLHDVRDWVNSHSHEFWETTFYTHWLNAICALNNQTQSNYRPKVMQSDAWADKTLHTQLGSWTQLRHDNILYAKPPYEVGAVCDYPSGYVEPYPEFYSILQGYAKFGLALFKNIDLPETDETYEAIQARLGYDLGRHEQDYIPHKAIYIRDKAITYFENLSSIMQTLESLARKELSGEDFTEEDKLFLRSIVVRKFVGDTGYGGWTEEHWDGWYNDLLPFDDDWCTLIADVHTNTNSDIGEVGVMHLGLDDPALILMMLECDGKHALYAGPTYTLYEHFEKGFPPNRLTDRDWSLYVQNHTVESLKSSKRLLKAHQDELNTLSQKTTLDDKEQNRLAFLHRRITDTENHIAEFEILSAPQWTSQFRVPATQKHMLYLPPAYIDFKESLSERLRNSLDDIMVALERKRNYYGFSIGDLVQIAENEPRRIRKIDGMNNNLFNELIDALKKKGYLK